MQHTKQQIQEAIAYWQRHLDEIEKSKKLPDIMEPDLPNTGASLSWIYVTKPNNSLTPKCIKIGYTTIENIQTKLLKLNTCVPEPFEISFKIDIGSQTQQNRYRLEHEFFNLLSADRYHSSKRQTATELFTCTDDDARNQFLTFNTQNNNQFKIV